MSKRKKYKKNEPKLKNGSWYWIKYTGERYANGQLKPSWVRLCNQKDTDGKEIPKSQVKELLKDLKVDHKADMRKNKNQKNNTPLSIINPSFVNVADRYLEYKERNRGKKKSKDNTIKICNRVLGLMKDYFSNIRIENIDIDRINGYVFSRRATGKNLSEVYLKLEIDILSALLNWSMKRNLITDLPDFPEFTVVRKEQKPITDEDYLNLLGACITENQKDYFRLGYFIGAGIFDLVNLTIENVDLTEKTLSYNRKKTGKKAVTYLDGDYLNLVERLYIIGEENSGYLLHNDKGKPWNENTASIMVRKIRDRAGLEWFTTHNLRHTVATRMLEQEKPVQAAEWIGDNVQTVFDNYIHPYESDQRRYAASLTSPESLTDKGL